jgi:hypothetical protein
LANAGIGFLSFLPTKIMPILNLGWVQVLEDANLAYDSKGVSTKKYRVSLVEMESGEFGKRLISAQELNKIVTNTILVLTTNPGRTEEWRETLAREMQQAEENRDAEDAAFFQVVLALLDGQTRELDEGNPYHPVYEAIEAQATVLDAVLAYLYAPDWGEAQKVIEHRREVLLGDEAEDMLAGLVQQAMDDKNQETEEYLRMHQTILHACRREEIEVVFDRLAQSSQE